MKIKLAAAFIFFTVGTAKIIDWFIFWEKNKQLALIDRKVFLDKYVGRFPDFIKPLIYSKTTLDVIFSMLLFLIAGLIFWNQKRIVYKVLAIISFLFGFWELWSLM